MIVPFIVYDASGRILRSGTCREDDLVHQATNAGESAIETEGIIDMRVGYVVDDVVTPRPASSVNCTSAGYAITLTGLPDGCEVRVSGSAYASFNADASGSMQITVPGPGSCTVQADPFPALPYSATVAIA